MKQNRISGTCKEKSGLSEEAVERIEKARQRIKAGNFATEEEARKGLGLRHAC